jgi:DNA-binding transcriptional LysR family regulator
MNLEYIKEFILLVETVNFAAAADALFISQATLSRHIMDIEEELKVPLFYRTSRKVILSEYGAVFLPYAKKMVTVQNEYTSELVRTHKANDSSITIGALQAMSCYNIMEPIALFKLKEPHIHFSIIQEKSPMLHDRLRNGDCDFAFMRDLGTEKDCEFDKLPFATDSLAVALSVNHPLAFADKIHLQQLKDEDFLLMPKYTTTYKLAMNACQKAGFEPHLAFDGTTGRAIFDMVGHGLCVSLLMKKPALQMCGLNSVLTDIDPPEHSYINLVYNYASLSTTGRHFLKFVQSWLKQNAKNSIEDTFGLGGR